MRPFFKPRLAVVLTLAGGLSLPSCSTKDDVSPAAVACSATATVRVCPGRTFECQTKHTTLELADGTRLRPTGPVWAAYQANQLAGQTLRIGYQRGAAVVASEPGDVYAALSCLEELAPDAAPTPGSK